METTTRSAVISSKVLRIKLDLGNILVTLWLSSAPYRHFGQVIKITPTYPSPSPKKAESRRSHEGNDKLHLKATLQKQRFVVVIIMIVVVGKTRFADPVYRVGRAEKGGVLVLNNFPFLLTDKCRTLNLKWKFK